MVGASRCCNSVIVVLCKVEYANTNNFFSPACTSIPWEINQEIQYLMRKKECRSLIFLIHKPIFTEMLQECTYQDSFILCHYQALPPSYLNLLRVCRLQPP